MYVEKLHKSQSNDYFIFIMRQFNGLKHRIYIFFTLKNKKIDDNNNNNNLLFERTKKRKGKRKCLY